MKSTARNNGNKILSRKVLSSLFGVTFVPFIAFESSAVEIIRWDNGIGSNYNSSCGNPTLYNLNVGGGASMFNTSGYWVGQNFHSGSGAKYWKVGFKTTGYQNIKVESHQAGAQAQFNEKYAPRDFKLQYSLDNSSWTDVSVVPALQLVAYGTQGNTWSGGALSNVSLPGAANNHGSVYLRWIMTSNTAIPGGSVLPVGQAEIDNIHITGDEIPQAPTGITLDNAVVGSTSGLTVGNLSATDPNCSDTYTYSLISGTGDSDNSSFSITGDVLQTGASQAPGTKSIRVRVNDGTYNFDQILTITVTAYPTISSGYNEEEHITHVQFNTIDNITGAEPNGYGDYSALQTSVTKESGHTLSVTYTPYSGYPGENIVAWIDWNGDFDFDDPGERYDLILGDPNSAPNTVTKSITIPTTSVSGDVRLRVVQSYETDAAKNSGTLEYGEAEDYTLHIQSSSPAAPSTPDMKAISDSGSSNNDNITNDNTPDFTGTAEPDSTISLKSSVEGVVGSTTADGSGDWTITSSTLSSGSHNIFATATNGGVTSPDSDTLPITIDIAQPSPPSTPDMTAETDDGISDSDNFTGDFTPTFVGTAESYSTVILTSSVDGVVATATAADTGEWELTVSTLTKGKHNITANATDKAGNTSTATSPLEITIDDTPPLENVVRILKVLTGAQSTESIHDVDGNGKADLGDVIATLKHLAGS